MSSRSSRWQDLPHGGAMRLVDGIPSEVTDKGAWQLDEIQILRDAEESCGIKLTWMHLSRARRWQRASITAILRAGGEWSWNIAKVVPAACDSCGVEVGKQWIGEPGAPDRIWVCDACQRRP